MNRVIQSVFLCGFLSIVSQSGASTMTPVSCTFTTPVDVLAINGTGSCHTQFLKNYAVSFEVKNGDILLTVDKSTTKCRNIKKMEGSDFYQMRCGPNLTVMQMDGHEAIFQFIQSLDEKGNSGTVLNKQICTMPYTLTKIEDMYGDATCASSSSGVGQLHFNYDKINHTQNFGNVASPAQCALIEGSYVKNTDGTSEALFQCADADQDFDAYFKTSGNMLMIYSTTEL